jgi:glycosyltransferase involved in cell wall biosynthesis
LPCTGLGREQRGFEAFARECAAAMRGTPGVEIELFGGGGPDARAGERPVWNLPRAGRAARALGGLIRRDPYFVEQWSFFAGMVPRLAAAAPDLIYFADVNLGNACWHWRRFTGQRYRLLYYNGGPTTRPFTRSDLVQQVSPEHYDAALQRGESPERQVLLPHGLAIDAAWRAGGPDERARIRESLGVPRDGRVVLSVGALNCGHKRMDYVVREVAALASPRPHLLMLGAATDETPGLQALAGSLLGEQGFTMRTLLRERVLDAYRAADMFVLASLVEGFGLAHVEALAAGLPCIAHDTATTRYIYGDQARLADLRAPGALAPLLAAALAEQLDDGLARIARARDRHAWAYGRFSWDVLAPQYAELFRACAAGRRPSIPSIPPIPSIPAIPAEDPS